MHGIGGFMHKNRNQLGYGPILIRSVKKYFWTVPQDFPEDRVYSEEANEVESSTKYPNGVNVIPGKHPFCSYQHAILSFFKYI